MKRIRGPVILITIFFFNSTMGQVAYAPETTSDVESENVYYFNFKEALLNKKVTKNNIPYRFDSLTLFIEDSTRFHNNRQSYHSENPHICQNRFQKFGVVDIHARQIIPFEYEFIQSKYSETFLIVKKGCYGAINSIGSTIVPFQYARAEQFDDNLFQFNYIKNEKLIDVYNRTGKFVFTIKALKLTKVGAGYYAVTNENNQFEKLIDSTGKQIFNVSEYSNIRWVKNGFICYYKNGKTGVINLKKESILPCVYGNISSTNMEQFIVYDSAMSGIVDSKNKFVVPLSKANFINFGNFYIAYGYRSDKKLLVNKEGKLISKNTFYIKDLPYDVGHIFGKKQEEKILIVTEMTTKLQGAYNLTGQQIVPPIFYRINYDISNNLMVGLKLDKTDSLKVLYDVRDFNGEIIIQDSPNPISFISENKNVLVVTNKQNKSGFFNIITKTSKSLFEYEWLSYRSKLAHGFFTANKNGFYALFSPDGDKLTAEIYSDFKMPDAKSQLKYGTKLFCYATRDNKIYGITKAGAEFLL